MTNKKEIFKQSRNYANTREEHNSYSMSEDENNIVEYIIKEFSFAESARADIETDWQDEYYIYKGGGLQWSTSFAYRKPENRSYRANSEDNFVFNAIENIVSNITMNIPEMTAEDLGNSLNKQIQQDKQVQQTQQNPAIMQNQEEQQNPGQITQPGQDQQIPGQEQQNPEQLQQVPPEMLQGMGMDQSPEQEEDTLSKKITDMSKFNDIRNNFRSMWKNAVRNFVAYGPLIIGVLWDEDWIGGRGPNRWVGDVRLINVKKEEFFPDPSIIDLTGRMQECRFIIRRIRKQTEWIRLQYPEKGLNVSDEFDEEGEEESGTKCTYLYEFWHRGYPFFVPEKRKKELNEEIKRLESQEGMEWKIKELSDMIKGNLEGIHLCYIANQQFLEYIPYVYDHGEYPFIFKCRYIDEKCQWGWGEIRNIKIPQVLHNKADELEMDSMARQGLGGEFVQAGAMTPRQKMEYTRKSGRCGEIFEVDNINGIQPRTPVIVPANITNYKDAKQRHIADISVSQIQMGRQPQAGMAYRTIQELGNRADARTQSVGEILEDALIEMNRIRISLFSQFYTEDRYYRIKGKDGNTTEGTLNKKEMFLTWDRIRTDEETGEQQTIKETFEVEFDINVKIIDEKPTDRGYYTQTAMQLVQMGKMTDHDLYYTLEEGKFPPRETILKNLREMQGIQGQQQQAQAQMETAMKQKEFSLKEAEMIMKHGQNQQGQQQKQNNGENNDNQQQKSAEEIIQYIQEQFPQVWELLQQIPEEELSKKIDELRNLNNDELEEAMIKLQQLAVQAELDDKK